MNPFRSIVLTALAVAAPAAAARPATFTTSNTTNAGSYGTLVGQSFSPSTSASPDPGLASGSTVYLQQFQFYQGDPSVTATNLELVILNGAYPNLTGLTTTSSAVVGISSNTIATTAGNTSGQAISFNFANLPVTYGNTYAAGLFTQSGTTLTPASISALTANYVLDSSGDTDNGQYIPTTNYGGLDNYNAAADGGVSGGYYGAYSHGGDANFYATLATSIPEPATATAALAGLAIAGVRRRGKSA